MSADQSPMDASGAESEIARPWLSQRTARWLTPVFLVLGVQCWLVLGEGEYGHQDKPLLILGAILAGLIPPINRAFDYFWKAVSRPSPLARTLIAIGICLAASVFCYWTQRYEHVAIRPKYADEFSYLLQAHMLAAGRLWMPALPLPEYFDTFYVLVKPVYASMYFPGAAMMYAPALALHLPYVVGPVMASGLCAALVYLVFCEVLDGASALLAVLLLLSLPMFRMMSIMLMAQTPTLLLGLVMTWSVLKWRKRMHARWLVLLGASAGWAAITRPADALCFAIVVGAVMLMDLRGKSRQVWLKTTAIVVTCALPFLIFQLSLNHGITGKRGTSPFSLWNDANYPGAFGFHSGPMPEHVSNVPEIQRFYETDAKIKIERHQWKNLGQGLQGEFEMAKRSAVADPFLWLIMPLSLPAMFSRKLWAVWGMFPVFLLGMSWYAFTWDLPHYYVMVMPAMILWTVLPIRFLTDVFPRRAAMIRTMIGLGIVALALTWMPMFNRIIHDPYFEARELATINANLEREVRGPAVVVFHFDSHAPTGGMGVANNPSEEPVFNSQVIWPDDAEVIRARDLNRDMSAIGKPNDLNAPLYAYYARLSPLRVFYLYDRADGKVRRLGTGQEMLTRILRSAVH
jgi:hypothetical protein